MDESREDITSFYYQKRYDPNTARFEDPGPEIEPKTGVKYRFCAACSNSSNVTTTSRPQVFEKLEEKSSKEVLYGMVKFRDEEFRTGSAVYLQAKTFKFKNPPPYQNAIRIPKQEVDEDRFPEYYRKFNDRIKGSNFDTPEPFDIGYVTNIFATTNVKLLAASNLYIKVKKLYRPENTFKTESLKQRSDVNLLFWSEEGELSAKRKFSLITFPLLLFLKLFLFNFLEVTVPFSSVAGKCYLAYSENIENIEAWSTAGPNRFYFAQMYINKDEEFDDPPPKACSIGKIAKTSDKLKSKSKRAEHQTKFVDIPPEYPPISTKLRTLDVFAGCGGKIIQFSYRNEFYPHGYFQIFRTVRGFETSWCLRE